MNNLSTNLMIEDGRWIVTGRSSRQYVLSRTSLHFSSFSAESAKFLHVVLVVLVVLVCFISRRQPRGGPCLGLALWSLDHAGSCHHSRSSAPVPLPETMGTSRDKQRQVKTIGTWGTIGARLGIASAFSSEH